MKPRFTSKYDRSPLYKNIIILVELLFALTITIFCAIYLFHVQETPFLYSLETAQDIIAECQRQQNGCERVNALNAAHDILEGSGWYGPEQNETITYRWTKSSAEVRLPLRYNSGRHYIAILTGLSVHPEEPQPIRFFLNDQFLAETPSSYTMRTYRISLIPSQGDAGLRFSFATNGFRRENDNRDLGILVDELFIQSIPVMNWTAIVGLPISLFIFWVLARQRTALATTFLLLIIQVVALLAVATAYRPTALAFEHFAFLTIIAATLSILIAIDNISRLVLSILVILVGYSGIIWSLAFTDDAFISFRYAHNLVHGYGLVFNPGERVEGYTNFLWTILFSVIIWLNGDPVFWAYILGIVLGFAITFLTYRVATQVVGAQWAIMPALLVAGNQSVLIYTARGSGMETGFFTLLVLLGISAYLARQTNNIISYCTSGIFFALATLTRPEGAIFFSLTITHAFINDFTKEKGNKLVLFRIKYAVKKLFPMASFFFVVFLSHLIWRIWYYGDVLPNTFYAKVGSGIQQWLRGLEYTGQFAQTIGAVFFAVALVYPLLLLFTPHLRRESTTSATLYAWLLCAVYTIYIIYVGGDHFPGERFFVPIIPLLAILITGSLALLTQQPIVRRLPHIVPMLSIVVALSILSTSLYRGEFFEQRVLGNDESVWIWADLGKWLYRHTPPDASIAAAGIGAIAYYSQREVIDMYGLTDKHIARLPAENMGSGAPGHEKQDPAYILNVRKPTYIPSLWENYFGGSAVLQANYNSIDIRTERGFYLELWQRKRIAAPISPLTFPYTDRP